ncbi:MAG: thiamine phosphate synthase [Lysinibacillus sp.]
MYFNLDKYFVMGSNNCHHQIPLQVLESALQAGVTMFQFREKGLDALSGEEYIQFAKQCQLLCRRFQVPFIINDDLHLAIKLNADGLHIGQDDGDIAHIRKLIPNKILGVSVHTLSQLDEAIVKGADYVGIGPIFKTTSKDDAIQSSLSFLTEAREQQPQFPIVAIGGITTKNSKVVRQAGATGVAVISEITQSKNVIQTIKEL